MPESGPFGAGWGTSLDACRPVLCGKFLVIGSQMDPLEIKGLDQL